MKHIKLVIDLTVDDLSVAQYVYHYILGSTLGEFTKLKPRIALYEVITTTLEKALVTTDCLIRADSEQ
mgnify:CR=1 FL=1